MKPVKRKILVRKCLSATPVKIDGMMAYMTGGVVIPSGFAQRTNWAEVVDISDDCDVFTRSHIGGFVLLPEWSPQKMTRVNTYVEDGVEIDEFIVRESLFLDDGGAKPMIALESLE